MALTHGPTSGHRTLARSYGDPSLELDSQDREKLEMLESYMSAATGEDAEGGPASSSADASAPMPTTATTPPDNHRQYQT